MISLAKTESNLMLRRRRTGCSWRKGWKGDARGFEVGAQAAADGTWRARAHFKRDNAALLMSPA